MNDTSFAGSDRMPAAHPDRALFDQVQQRLPPGTSDEVTAHVALAAKMGGIGAGEISKFEVHGDRAFMLGRIPGDKAAVDLAQVPPLPETLQRSQAFDQQQAVAISAQPAAVQRQDAEAPPPPPRIS